MAAFRPVPPLFQFTDNLHVPCAGGELRFYDTLTLDARNVFSDEDLSVNLGATITLDSAGRAPSDLWGSGVYRVRLYTAEDVLVDEADPVQEEGAAGSQIPSQTGNSGEFLTTNGTVMSWTTIRQAPDPTGQSGKVLSNDGTDFLWKTLVELGLPTVTEGTGTAPGKITLGAYTIQFGTDTFPVPSVSPPHGAVKAVTFPTAFTTVVCYGAFGNKNTVASFDCKPVVSCEATTTTLTAQYNNNMAETAGVYDIAVTVPFSWFVIGKL